MPRHAPGHGTPYNKMQAAAVKICSYSRLTSFLYQCYACTSYDVPLQ